ncbi:hypothetical protein GCM10022234_34860 [Aeromicrobium panaciterrae]
MLLVFGLVLAFVLNRNGDDDTPEATPTPTTPTTTTATTDAPAPGTEEPFVVAPGRVGAAKVGMTISEAASTGLFNTNVDHGADDCRGVAPLEWKPPAGAGLDVFVNDSVTIVTIVSIGISKDGPRTAKGIGVGSTLAEVRSAYADLTPLEEAGFGQSGNYVVDGDRYLGFLFNENESDASDSSKVVFMEVTKGHKPELIRDGC